MAESIIEVRDYKLPVVKRVRGSSSSDKLTAVFFGRVLQQLLEALTTIKPSYCFGCCPYITCAEIVTAMENLSGACIITMFPGSGEFNKMKESTHKAVEGYKKLVWVNKVEEKDVLHGKYLIFLDKDKQPFAVWSGSVNWTVNSLHLGAYGDTGMLSMDKPVVTAYFEEFKLRYYKEVPPTPAIKSVDAVKKREESFASPAATEASSAGQTPTNDATSAIVENELTPALSVMKTSEDDDDDRCKRCGRKDSTCYCGSW